MAFDFQPKSLDEILAGAPGRVGRTVPIPLGGGPKPLWAVIGEAAPYGWQTGGGLSMERSPVKFAQAQTGETGAGQVDPGAAWEGINPDGYAFSNPRVVDNLKRLRQAIVHQGISADDFSIRVSGGDRDRDTDGVIRSSTNHEVVKGASPTSPHLVERGARAADIVVKGVPREVFERALSETEFLPANTQYYEDGHTHVALPNRPEYYAPK